MREHADNLDVLSRLLHLRCRLCRRDRLVRAVDMNGRPRIDNSRDREFRKAWDARVEAGASL